MSQASAYPREFEREVTLEDGARVRIRPIRPDDEPRLIAFHSRLSLQTIHQRFFSGKRRLSSRWAHALANVDYRRRLAFVVEHEIEGTPELIAVGRYEPTDESQVVEVAFVVQDAWQERGIGTILFQDVLRAAEANGIHRFRASVLAANSRMLDLISRFAEVEWRKTEAGVTELLFTSRSPGAQGDPTRPRTSTARVPRGPTSSGFTSSS